MSEPHPHRNLRITTIFLWIPTFALLLPHGVITSHAFPALCILPMTVSALVGIATMLEKHRKQVIAIADIATALFLFTFLIPSWVLLDGHHYYDHLAVLGAYGTAPAMVNLGFHIYFAADAYHEVILKNIRARLAPRTCQHCMCQIEVSNEVSSPAMSEKETFRDAQEVTEPRPSTDDETARLV